MRMTYNWLRELCPVTLSAEETARRLSLSGCLIEEIHPLPGDTLYVAEITSNRPDLLGAIGIAREMSALTGVALVTPKTDFTIGPERVESAAAVEVHAPDLCPRYTARLIRGVKIGPSPDWLRARLESVNIRAINNVVDVTNYVMFECGQPLHAFDFDRLHGGKIIVRRPYDGEVLTSIDGTQCKLKPSMLAICDADHPVAVAGIMGGLETEIAAGTVNVLLESAVFENTNIRRTSRALALASDSSYRFERGIDPVQTEWASRRAAYLIQQLAGGQVCEGILDFWAKPYVPAEVALRYARLNKLLGTAVAPDVAAAILERLGFARTPAADGRRVVVQVPPWRAADVSREADLIEEVIRIYGYDKIPDTGTLPATVGRVSKFERCIDAARRVMIGAGYFDVITSSFYTEPMAKLVSPWTSAPALTFNNSIRRDEDRLRTTLLPALLAVKRTNAAHGVARAPVFEINRVFLPRPPRTEGAPARDDALPVERNMLAVLDEDDLLHLKGAIESLADVLGLAGRVKFESSADAFFAEKRGARILLDGAPVGLMGELGPAACAQYDLPRPPFMAELDFERLVEAANLERTYAKLPTQPAAVRDLAVIVDEAVTWERIESAVRALNIPILESIEFFDIFRGKQVPAGKKSLAFSLTFRAPDRTLTSEEVETARQACINAITALGGTLRG